MAFRSESMIMHSAGTHENFQQHRFCLLALAVAIVLAVAGSKPASAAEQSTAQPLAVGVYLSAPFVMKKNGQFTGMAIDLWESLASRLGLKFKYRVLPTFRALTNAVASGDIDVAVTNLTITQERAKRIDFSQPWFDGGLRVMVNDQRAADFSDIISGLKVSGHLAAFAFIALIVMFATLVLTVFDRRFDNEFPSRWREGLADSFFAVISTATSGRMPARKNMFGWVGRIWQALWMICGIAVIAYVTSSITTVMTTLSLTNEIHGVADLSGKSVGVFSGSVAEGYSRDAGLASQPFDNIDDAVTALRKDRITAIVGDAPVLEYYAHEHPEAAVSVVGQLFQPDKYGFGFKQGSPLTKPVTLGILGAKEDGLVEQLDGRYFGPNG